MTTTTATIAQIADIDTDQYEANHGRKPHGDGYWIFRNADGEQIDVTADYAKVLRWLPAGTWTVMP